MTAGGEPPAAELDEGGDPSCWLHLVCDGCGAVLEHRPDGAACPVCGAVPDPG